MLLGSRFFAMLGTTPPGFLADLITEPSFTTVFLIHFMGNTIAQNLVNTGAFEVS